MSNTIESLEIEVIGSSQSAEQALDALEESLGRLKTAVKGGCGLTAVTNQLRDKHETDNTAIQEEQTLVIYGLLACLKGLNEQGCNGAVTEAIGKIEKHINQKAHHH